MNALFREMRIYMDQAVKLNVNTMLDDALRVTRITMSPAERKQFYDKHIKSMQLVISETGDVSLALKVK